MLQQTLALFHDAYRELNGKRMFWVALVISFVVVLSFTLIGVTPEGNLSLLGMATPLPLPFSTVELYKVAFSYLGVGMWLTLFGLILALISTAGMFPELITGGAVDLYLSKPISRLRLFLTKYLAGLLFVTLQVLVFCAASFLVIGVRGGLWEPRMFLAVPLVVIVFSYLYCVCVLTGLLTRSTVAALLLTMLFWVVIFAIDQGEVVALMGRIYARDQIENEDLVVKQRRGSLHAFEERLAATQPTDVQRRDLAERRQRLADAVATAAEAVTTSHRIEFLYKLAHAVKATLPKTRETNDLLDRAMMTPQELANVEANRRPSGAIRLHPPRPRAAGSGPPWADPEVVAEMKAQMLVRPISWVLGTSLLFEVVVLSLAAWVFCRRDY